MKSVADVLHSLNIPFESYDHPAVFTVAEADAIDRKIPAGHSKNLFLHNKKKDTYYLVVVPSTKRVDLKGLAAKLGESRLSFASPERMQQYLGLTPGSVSPFGLINDKDHLVHAVIDEELLQSEKVGFHPNINTGTYVVTREDFKKYLAWTGNMISYVLV